jgi:hypothetical protein
MYEILREEPAAGSWKSEKIPLNKRIAGTTFQLIWQNVSGAFDGEIYVYVTNDPRYATFLKTIPVDTADNRADCPAVVITEPFKYVFFDYIANGNTGGEISVVMN